MSNFLKPLFLDEEWSWNNLTLFQYIEEGNYPHSWKDFFEANKEDLKKISDSLSESKNTTIYPPINKVFRAFIPIEKIRVVILGQDPYHNGSGVGYCFSVLSGNAINPSLRNIYTELKSEGYTPKENGDLTHWAKQGCVMLNTALTVEKGSPESHISIWYNFCEKVIKEISSKTKNVAWLLMGAKALAFKPLIDTERGHKTFITSHPSPFSAHKGFQMYPAFLGSNVFRKINDFLDLQVQTISW